MTGLERDEVRRLLSDVTDRTGLDFHDRHLQQLQETIERAMQRCGCGTIAAFRRELKSSSETFDEFISDLTVGETYFFRDTRQFALIRDRILPEILQRCGGRRYPRVWSAGCSSGEEAYSLAILMEDATPGGLGRVLATDISQSSLRKARDARYRNWSLRGDMRTVAERFLKFEDGLYVLDQRIRRRVNFAPLNLAADSYPSAETETREMDLILCRNVLIYFDRETISEVLRKLWRSLSPGGWLVLGASDPHAAEFADFETITTPAGLAFRRRGVDHAVGGEMNSSAGPDLSQEKGSTVPQPPEPVASITPLALEQDLTPATTDGKLPDRTAADDPAEAISEQACVADVRVTLRESVEDAERRCARFLRQHPISTELLYLHAILLIDLKRTTEALEQLRRLIFLDRSLVIAHYTQGMALKQEGRPDDARRAFRNAHRLCQSLSSDELLRFGSGETAGQLHQAVEQQLSGL